MQKYKYYVIWEGRQTGIFDSWPVCKSLINGYAGAKFKGFKNRSDAETALKGYYKDYYRNRNRKRKKSAKR